MVVETGNRPTWSLFNSVASRGRSISALC